MLRNSSFRFIFVGLLVLFAGGVFWQAIAQEETQEPQPEVTTEAPVQQITDTPTPTPTPVPLTVTHSEPSRITSGQQATLSVFGTNFTESSVIRVVGVGLITTTFINNTALTAVVPATVPAGTYTVEATDPERGTAASPNTLVVVAPPPTPSTTFPTPTVIPTPIPGTPSLLVRSYSVTPGTIQPGQSTTVTLEIINIGNKVAQGVSIQVDSSGAFVPANGQLSITLPNIAPGGSFNATISVTAKPGINAGPNTIAINMNYRDELAVIYTTAASIPVTILVVPEASQVTLSRYLVNPSPAKPGEPVTVTVLLTNTGNEAASQVLFRVDHNGVLLAGPQGDSFPMGDIAPGASASVELPLVVSTDAKAGPQAQAITLTYLQEGESQQVTGSMTIDIEKVERPEPLLLIASYDTGNEYLIPGQQFTLTAAISNLGTADAANMLVTFGTVETSGSATSTSRSTTTTASTNFAPLNSAGTLFVGTIEAGGGSITVQQDFIAGGTLDSGIYSLPVTLRYQQPDGTAAEDKLTISLVVVVPPKLQFDSQGGIPPSVMVGDSVPILLDITNRGNKVVNLGDAIIEAENGIVVSGDTTFLGTLQINGDISLASTVIADAEGTLVITLTINYLDDLNQPRTLVQTFETEVIAAPPTQVVSFPTPDMSFEPPIVEVQPNNNDDFLGRLLLGLLGLGS